MSEQQKPFQIVVFVCPLCHFMAFDKDVSVNDLDCPNCDYRMDEKRLEEVNYE